MSIAIENPTARRPFEVARDYTRRGLRVLPIPFRKKRPVLVDWQNLRLDEADLSAHFNGQPQNVGVLTGEPSGWLVDVDLDHPEAVALGRDYLPPTESTFGRESKRTSHYLYRVARPVETVKFQTAKREMLVELRSTGCQTVFPGSVHESGEPVEWEGRGEPALVDPDELLAAVRQLAEDTAEHIGEPLKREKTAGDPPRQRQPKAADAVERAWKYLCKCDDAIAGQGGHDATFHAACECFRFGLDEADALVVMRRFNAEKCSPVWSDGELAHKVADAREKVTVDGENGSRLKDRRGATAAAPAGEHRGDFPLTDAGNGERFAEQWRDVLRYDAAAGRWRYFDGQRWTADEVGRATNYAKRTARSMYEQAAGGDKLDKELARWALRCEAKERLAAMADLARSEPGMTVTAEQWDADPWALNVLNGTLDLRTGTLRPHRAADLLTKLAPVVFDAAADCPLWLTFLREIFANDAALINYLQRFFGYTLAAVRPEHLLLVFHGGGANGKSTLLDVLCHVFGEYAMTAPPDLLIEKRGEQHPTDIASLCGRRLVACSESKKHRRLDVALMKRLTGDETLSGRFMRQDFFSFRRTFALVMATNNRPTVDEDSEGVWRRLKLVPFNVTIPAEQRDKALADKLKAEASGILRWLADGCLDWQRDGLGDSEAVQAATQGYRNESDPLRGFTTECCTLTPDAWTANTTLRQAYERFAAEQGERAIGGRDWTDALRRHGATPHRRYTGRGWSGIGLLETMTP